MPMPTPLGVPVVMISPDSSVMPVVKVAMQLAISKIMSPVLESCTVAPFRRSWMRRAWGSGISSAVTSHGPMGAEPSRLLL